MSYCPKCKQDLRIGGSPHTCQDKSEMPFGSDTLVLPLRLIELDSPWLFGIGRDMTDEECENAEKHGRNYKLPMSVLGVTHEGLAAVDGKDLAQLFVFSPKLLAVVRKLAAWDKRWPKWSDTNGTSEKELNAICEEAHAIIAEASGQNAGAHPTP